MASGTENEEQRKPEVATTLGQQLIPSEIGWMLYLACSGKDGLQFRNNALCSALKWVGPNSPVDIVSKFQEAFLSFFQAVLNDPFNKQDVRELDDPLACGDIHGAAYHAVAPAFFIKNTRNQAIIQMALPHVRQVLRPASRSPDNFGHLACGFLDMGGEVEALIAPVKLILESQEAAPCGENPDSPEERLARHLCCAGFISFLNHPRLKESPELTNLLRPFAGQIIRDAYWQRYDPCVLLFVRGGVRVFAWGRRASIGKSQNILAQDQDEGLSGEFKKNRVPKEVMDLAELFYEKKGADDMVGEVARTAFCAMRGWDLG